jgi:hypothetical protein
MKPPLPFNRVIMRTAEGPQQLTVSEFEQVPLTERVQALLERRVEFFRDQQRIGALHALKALRER